MSQGAGSDIFSETTKEQIDFIKKKYVGKKLGFTCSCFDILHCGHAIMLEDASKNCDVLVIGLQTDPTLDRAEKNKPVQSYDERKIMINAIKYVDEVIEYATESDLLNILVYLNPDVRVLGTDWNGKEYTGHHLEIPIHWHRRDHNWSTSYLRKRVAYAEERKRLDKLGSS